MRDVAGDTAPEAGAVAAGGAVRVSPAQLGRILLVLLGGAVEYVAGTAAADMADGGGLLADLGAGELLVEGQNGALSREVSVTGTATAGVEVAGAGRSGGGGSRDTGRSSGGWSTEEVASTSTTRVGVAVLGNSGVGLGDSVERRHFGFVSCVSGDVRELGLKREVWLRVEVKGSFGQEMLLLLLEILGNCRQ